MADVSLPASVDARWTIQMWSWASTSTPMVEPSSQWLGSGLGHSGSTSNIGACGPFASGAGAAAWLVAAASTASVTPGSPLHAAATATSVSVAMRPHLLRNDIQCLLTGPSRESL